MPLGHLYVFFGEMSVSVFHFLIGLFIFLILSCMSCFYILEINPLSVDSFANIFSHSEGCIFVLFMVFFAVQKLFFFFLILFIYLFIYGCVGSSFLCEGFLQLRQAGATLHRGA